MRDFALLRTACIRTFLLRLWFLLFALVTMLFIDSSAVMASYDLISVEGQPIELTATMQNREEVWNWFKPTGPYQNKYNFLGSWIRVGAGYQLHGVKFFGELMTPYMLNLPDNAIAPKP